MAEVWVDGNAFVYTERDMREIVEKTRAEETELNKAWLTSLTKWLLDEGHITPLGARLLQKGRG